MVEEPPTRQTGEWRSVYFKDVTLHRGESPVTVQVAWRQPKELSTASRMPGVISVYEGNGKSKRLITATPIGNVSYDAIAGEGFYSDSDSGESFLLVNMMYERFRTAIFRFEGNRPVLILQRQSLYPEMLAGTFTIVEASRAKEVGLVQPEDAYPDPSVVRDLRYDASSKRFRAGPWRVEVYNPPAEVLLKGKKGRHEFSLKMSKWYFKLDNRRTSVNAKGELCLDGIAAYGTGWDASDEFSRERLREFAGTELKSFQVWIDGREIVVPPDLWKGCFQPHLGHVTASLSADGRQLRIKMGGSDAGASYGVEWLIRTDGKHKRTIIEGDC